MKALKTLSIVVLFIPSLVFSQALEEFEKQMVARNHIAQKISTDYKYESGKYVTSGTRTSTTNYDRSGNITKIEYYNKNDSVSGTEIYEYDSRGNRILFERTGKSPYKKVSEYNERNNILLESGFNGAETFRTEYNYDLIGKLNDIISSANGQVQQKMVYNHTGNISHISIYIRGTSLSSKMKMVYDSKRNLIEEITYSLDGKEVEKKEYTYNAASQVVEETKYSKGKFFYRILNTYDSHNRLRSVTEETISKKKYTKKEYVYDDAGNLITYKWRRNPNEDFNIKTYTYNEQGICLTEETYYPTSKYKLLTRFSYSFY